ncbi:MAG: TonB-dependent receptor plug domain-containing protein [Opitutae bacterium]|nr:TonB-dependent receptor plug domain-containing protein [Opitutae bacterium]
MKTSRILAHRFGLFAAASGLLFASAQSQTAPKAPASSPAPVIEESIELTPFIVRATSDKSYGALNSTSITSFNTELEKLPISADIFTSAFMEDTNSTTLENMLRNYSAGAGTGSAAGDVGGIPVNQPLDRGGGDSVSAGVQLRGLGAAVVKQDSFMLPSPAGTGLNSNFGIDRIEVINGPQALLYGNGGGGGVVNMISKQARLGRRPAGFLKLQVDQYGHTLGQIDYSMGTEKIAVALSLLRQELGDNRDFMGGPLTGLYGQIAVRPWRNTIVRFTGRYTHFSRFIPQTLTLNAGSTTTDARHNQRIRYLIATNQLDVSAIGASGAGSIGNGHMNWDNVDSWGGNLREEITTARLAHVVFETNWRPWLSTQLSLGYQDKDSIVGYGSGATFYSPNASSNPLPGQWSMGAGGSSGSAWSNQPSSSKSIRFSILLTNDLFGGRARSQTIFGAEQTRGDYANENYAYYEADGNYNLVLNSSGQRIRMQTPNPYWSVHNGPVKYAVSRVGTERITYAGKNYVGQIMNLTDPALVSPQNPQGVTAGDLYIHSRAISKGAFAVNNTQWMDGKLATLAGVRWVSADNRQFASTAIPAITATGENLSFSVGANYGLKSWLRPYFAVSDTYNLPGVLLTVPADPYGNAAPISHSLGEEIGIKLGRDNGKISGSIALYAVQSTGEPYAIPSQLRDSINPAGLNGRHLGATGSVIAVDRKSQGLQAAITALPTPNWRMRLSAAFVQGTIGNNTSYGALYNDQFYTNAAGQVTYANGTVVYVRPTALTTPGTAASAGYIPLTVAKLSTPGDPYYANPDPTTGLLGSSTGRSVLNYTASPNGPIRTGVTGLPISQIQVTGVRPADNIVTSRAGDKTTGYPEMSFSFTNVYTVSTGLLRGLKVGGTVNLAWRRADYYYYPTGYSPTASREMFYRPTQALFNAILGYERRLKRVTWSTQLNIDNILNHYSVLIRPNNISGYAGISDALFTNQPREITWTNTIKF